LGRAQTVGSHRGGAGVQRVAQIVFEISAHG
jgi:hypothetical protein